MKSCRICWTLVVLFALALAFVAYRMVTGKVQPTEDGRVGVVLTKGERNLVLAEMRTWLENSQRILAAANGNDLGEVARLARASGMGAEAGTPASLMMKIPLEMKTLGFGTRGKFDAIAAEAEKTKDPKRILAELSDAMGGCIACHATYRFVEQ